MQPLEILSRVFSLLGECQSSELRAAADVAEVSPALRKALLGLAEAKRGIELRTSHIATGKKERKRERARSRDKVSAKRGSNGHEEMVKRLVMDQRTFSTTEEIRNYLNGLKVGISFSTKEGRDRMARRLVRFLESLSTSDRREAMAKLLHVFPKSQTSGWFDVIRGGDAE